MPKNNLEETPGEKVKRLSMILLEEFFQDLHEGKFLDLLSYQFLGISDSEYLVYNLMEQTTEILQIPA